MLSNAEIFNSKINFRILVVEDDKNNLNTYCRELKEAFDNKKIGNIIHRATCFKEAEKLISENYYHGLSLDQKIPYGPNDVPENSHGIKLSKLFWKENKLSFTSILTGNAKHKPALETKDVVDIYIDKEDYLNHIDEWAALITTNFVSFLDKAFDRSSDLLPYAIAILSAKIHTEESYLHKIRTLCKLWEHALQYILLTGLALMKSISEKDYDEVYQRFQRNDKRIEKDGLGAGNYVEGIETCMRVASKYRNTSITKWLRYFSKDVFLAIRKIHIFRNREFAHDKDINEAKCKIIWEEIKPAAVCFLAGCSFFDRYPLVWNLKSDHTANSLYFTGQLISGQKEIPSHSPRITRRALPYPEKEYLYFVMENDETSDYEFYTLYPHFIIESLTDSPRPNIWTMHKPQSSIYRDLTTYEERYFVIEG